MDQATIHLQTLLGLGAGKLGETDKSERRIDALGAELTMTTGAKALWSRDAARVRSLADRMDKRSRQDS